MKGHLLIVEDDPDLAENLVEILEGLDWQVDVCGSAEHALEMLAEHAYEGVVTDFRLPGLGGVELIVHLRREGVDVPVLVMSAFMDDLSAAQAEKAGALDVLAKPLDLPRLFQVLDNFIRSTDQVLIVEDNMALAENVAEALRSEGFRPEVAQDGQGALSRRMLPRVALVDLRLPDLNGIEVARRLYARDPSIKILFITAYDEDITENIETVLREFPCIDPSNPCLRKPFSLPELVERVRHAVQV